MPLPSLITDMFGNPCKQAHWQTLVDDGHALIMQQPKEMGNARVEIMVNAKAGLMTPHDDMTI